MADHIRKQLRTAIAAALANLTTTGSRVEAYRFYPKQDAKLPALSIYTPSETAQTETVSTPSLVGRDLAIRVVGYAKDKTDVEETLDEIAKEVEVALAAGVQVGSGPDVRTIDLEYKGCTIEFGTVEKPAGSIELEYVAKLFNVAGAPDSFS